MGIEIFAIIFIIFTFIILLSGIPVAFVLSGSALLFSFIGTNFSFLFERLFVKKISLLIVLEIYLILRFVNLFD